MQKWKPDAIVLGLGALIVLVDQITKVLVERNLTYQVPWNPIEALKPYISLTYVTNTGAAFGMFKQGSLFFTITSILVIIGILFYYRHLPKNASLLFVSLGMQLGGATGNLIDRLIRGHVVDFVNINIWPVWNVADSFIVIGSIMLGYYLLFVWEEDDPANSNGEVQASN